MQLLQHFKELTVRPKNAQELKGLILQLAIQGKLTGKWRSENKDIKSASELLKEIRKERIQLIKEKKVRKGKPIQPIKKEEKYLEIPQNWVWIRLIETGNIFNGNSVNKAIKESKYEGLEEGLPYLGTKDVNYGFEALNYDNGVKIPFDEPKFKIAHKNTALICSEGGSAGKKCGITTEDICFGNKLYALEQYGDIESVYILSIYKAPVFFEVFLSKMTGIIGGVSINSFGEIPIPLPPLEEQKEIVKVVETLFKEVEQLEQLTVERISLKEDFVTSALNQLTTNNANQEWTFLQEHFKSFFNETTNIKKLRETVLQLAVQGKLTADWRVNNPDTEDASVLLKRIQEEKAQLIKDKKIKKEKALPKITKEEIPYELPEGWVWCRMQDVFKDLRYGTSKKCDYKLGVNPVLRIPNLKYGGIDVTDLKTTNLSERELKDLSLGRGDLLIIRSNGSENLVGRSSVVTNVGVGYSFAGYLVRLQVFTDYVESSYLHTVLESAMIRTAIEGPLRTTSGVKNINSTEISRLIIPIPSKEEQKAIVEKVNALMGLCDSLEQEVQQSQEHSEQLMQSCLREVFAGESN
ncbi:restriction endonuclease subunit S [Algibacter sp. L1A34]|uniref:restriction endonuclease subunit S n=1 Tax=Algibacter sp. L1A34 TaxID=2686365 RepID=UPI00131AABBE|nr:restriction endonuclease subunit S [Algibacter sp. L1A34]